jgi:hypothetical protein
MHPEVRHAYRREVIRERPAVRVLVLVAPLVSIVTTLTLLALVAPAASRPQRREVSRASLRYCADPGHCGGNMMLSVSRAEATATSFARAWASDWNTWAAAHDVQQQIVTAGCNYLATERYYLCAVRVMSGARASPGASCGLIVIKPTTLPNPRDQIQNGLETACRILSAFPQHIVD